MNPIQASILLALEASVREAAYHLGEAVRWAHDPDAATDDALRLALMHTMGDLMKARVTAELSLNRIGYALQQAGLADQSEPVLDEQAAPF